jgi:hypothetical protein
VRQSNRSRSDNDDVFGGDGGNSGNTLTEAQYGAILAIANKVFGRSAKDELAKMADKPVAELSKSEASALIDRLRGMAAPGGSDSGSRPRGEAPAASRAARNGASVG